MPKLQQTYNRHSFVEQMRKPLAFYEEWLLNLVQNV
jgi:hypothetical protein